MAYALRRELAEPFEGVLARLPQALQAEGFGVLTEVDVRETLKKKLNVDFRHYRILGACNPPLAHQALQAELEIGLMMPCNVVVYEKEQGKTVVAAVDPMRTIASVGNPSLEAPAVAVREKLQRVLDAL